MCLLLFTSIFVVGLFHQLPISHSFPNHQQELPLLLPNPCNDRCGSFQIPYPFHLNSSCGSADFAAFSLSCLNSSALFLNISSKFYRVLEFFSDGILVDFPGTSSCRQYNDLNSFGFGGNGQYGISLDNVVGLYDCEDSSLCQTDCERSFISGCNGSASAFAAAACCYPLSNPNVWRVGDGFSVFSQFGCRGFSSWVASPRMDIWKRGVKLEWAILRNSSSGACATNAYIVNATSVGAGIRCQCPTGFIGDGFAEGVGCLKSCLKDGREAYGKDCYIKRHKERKLVILAGVLSSVFTVASLVALFCILKRPVKLGTFHAGNAHCLSTISFPNACSTRLFTYHELQEATRGFEDGQKLVYGSNGTFYAGVLGNGLHVAVQKVQCGSESELIQVLSRVEVLSTVLHRNMACLLGCCIEPGCMPLVVYEFPGNGTLEDHLLQRSGQDFVLEWYKRLNIAAETSSVLAFLQCQISPPIFHHNLKSCYIFLDGDFSVKLSGFELLCSNPGDETRVNNNSEGSHFHGNDVYCLGVLLLEIIAGCRGLDLPTVALKKIRSGKVEEIVDPLLYYHEQPAFRREQIEIVADLATRCLLFGSDGKLSMVDVAWELAHISKESIGGDSRRGAALQETFSNSSLLQMISMSPDSIYVP